MFCSTRFAVSLRHVNSSRFFRSITTQSLKQHKITEEEVKDEETVEEETLDSFTKEFLGNQIKITDFQRILLTAGSSVAALLNPRRHDMIACLGETTGEDALQKVLQVMKTSEEGKQILLQKPRINTRTVDLNALKAMSPDTMGYHYYKFLSDNVCRKPHSKVLF